jgi:hypothetical protein
MEAGVSDRLWSHDDLVERTSPIEVAAMPWYEVIALGCAGGILPDMLGIIKARHGKPPAYLKSQFFWMSLCFLAFLGGAASYFSQADKVIEALTMGYSAPTIISKVLGSEHPSETLGSLPGGGSFAGPAGGPGIPIPNFFAPLQRWWALN